MTFSLGSEVTPGFSFATPGPAVGVSSLAFRIDNLRGWTIELAWLDRLFLRAFCESVSIHRYYDQLRLPNARPRFLRHPARPLVPVVSAFGLWIDPAERRAFPGLGALISRWTPTKCSLRIVPRLVRQEADEALKSYRTIPLST